MSDLLALEIIVAIGVSLVVGTVAAQRPRVAPPVLLLAAGAALAYAPSLRGVHPPPITPKTSATHLSSCATTSPRSPPANSSTPPAGAALTGGTSNSKPPTRSVRSDG